MRHGKNVIRLYFNGGKTLSICQNFNNGVKQAQEVLDITNGFDGDPIPFGTTVEDLILVLQQMIIDDLNKETGQ